MCSDLLFIRSSKKSFQKKKKKKKNLSLVYVCLLPLVESYDKEE